MAITDIKAYAHLSPQDVEDLAAELDAIRADIEESRGERDAQYIRRAIQLQRGLAVFGRLALFASSSRIARLAGITSLASSKIIENMELGHNIIHGQWDWMNDPKSTQRSGNGIRRARRRSGSTRTISCTTSTPMSWVWTPTSVRYHAGQRRERAPSSACSRPKATSHCRTHPRKQSCSSRPAVASHLSWRCCDRCGRVVSSRTSSTCTRRGRRMR